MNRVKNRGMRRKGSLVSVTGGVSGPSHPRKKRDRGNWLLTLKTLRPSSIYIQKERDSSLQSWLIDKADSHQQFIRPRFYIKRWRWCYGQNFSLSLVIEDTLSISPALGRPLWHSHGTFFVRKSLCPCYQAAWINQGSYCQQALGQVSYQQEGGSHISHRSNPGTHSTWVHTPLYRSVPASSSCIKSPVPCPLRNCEYWNNSYPRAVTSSHFYWYYFP